MRAEHAADPATDLEDNTTPHLAADMERLRAHLGIDRWLVYGNSWGTTLALSYAQRHPERVSEIVPLAVTTTRRSEIDWLYHGAGRFFHQLAPRPRPPQLPRRHRGGRASRVGSGHGGSRGGGDGSVCGHGVTSLGS